MPILGIIASSMVGTPTSPVAGYKVWLDAADTSTIALSGSAVTQWNDKSGSAYAFSQGTAGYRPVSGTTTQNGKNVIVFDTDDTLLSTAASSVWKFLNDGTTYTIFIATKESATDAGRVWMSTDGNTSANVGFRFRGNPTRLLEHAVLKGTGGSPSVNNITANNVVDTNFTYLTILGDPSNGTAANRSSITVKQGSAIKNNTDSQSVSNTNPFETLRIGDISAGGGVSIDGQLGEILIYESTLSGANILLNQQYLANKWGV